MNLSQLIRQEKTRQRASYDALADRSHDRGAGVTASYLWQLETRPLNSVTHKLVLGVAAALAESDADIPKMQKLVAAACWESWGFTVHELPSTSPLSERVTVMSGCVVVSTAGLTVVEALEVQRAAENAIATVSAGQTAPNGMEVRTNGAGASDVNPSPCAPLFSNSLPSPRVHPVDSSRPAGNKERPAPGGVSRAGRPQTAS